MAGKVRLVGTRLMHVDMYSPKCNPTPVCGNTSQTPDQRASVPFELVLFVPDVVRLVVVEEVCDARGQVAVDAVHVAGRGHNGTHVLVTVLYALLHLSHAHVHTHTQTDRQTHTQNTSLYGTF